MAERAGHCRVKPGLRERVVFQQWNLFQPSYPFAQRFHVIVCRNVMIYFDPPTQETLIARLAEQIEPGGHLIVGHSESLSRIQHSLRQVHPTVYLKASGGAK